MTKEDKKAKAERVATLYAGYIAQGQKRDVALRLALETDDLIMSSLGSTSNSSQKG